MKTNKSFAKRIKLTKNGKLKARKPGQNHFNAKEGSARKLDKKRSKDVTMTNKAKARFLANM
jgi:ribosomal protein L35